MRPRWTLDVFDTCFCTKTASLRVCEFRNAQCKDFKQESLVTKDILRKVASSWLWSSQRVKYR